MASMGRTASNTGWPPRGSLYIPTTAPPAFSTAARASTAGPSTFSRRDSPGVSPWVPGLAFRGRRRTGARLTMATHSNCDSTSSPNQFAPCHRNQKKSPEYPALIGIRSWGTLLDVPGLGLARRVTLRAVMRYDSNSANRTDTRKSTEPAKADLSTYGPECGPQLIDARCDPRPKGHGVR
jgi:hypothetical protein